MHFRWSLLTVHQCVFRYLQYDIWSTHQSLTIWYSLSGFCLFTDHCLTSLFFQKPSSRETFNFHNFRWSTPGKIIQYQWGIVSLMVWHTKNKMDCGCRRDTFPSLMPCHLAEASLRQQRRGVASASADWLAVCACLIYPCLSSARYYWFTRLQKRTEAVFRRRDGIPQQVLSDFINAAL